LQQSHRSAADECLMLRYKNSLLERILLEKGSLSTSWTTAGLSIVSSFQLTFVQALMCRPSCR
jgi:hypothetical protein